MATTQHAVLLQISAQLDDKELNLLVDNMKKAGVEIEKLEGKSEKTFSKMENSTGRAANAMGKLLIKIAGLAFASKKAFNEAKDLIKSQVQLRQTIKSTGGAADLTEKQLLKMAEALQEITGLKRADILRAESLMLTFTKIGKEAFPAALKAAADMSVVLGIDLQQAIKKVGTALSDPVKGIKDLQNSGVALNKQQIKQIKLFTKQNNILGAQQVILKKIASSYDGAAEAMSKTPFGQMELAVSKFNDVLAKLGKIFLPLLGDLATLFATIFGFLDKLPASVKTAVIAIGGLALAFAGPMAAVIGITAAVAALWDNFRLLNVSLKDVKGIVAGTQKQIREFSKEIITAQKNMQLAERFKGLQRGTAEYNRTLNALKRINPALTRTNKQLGRSYVDLANDVRKVSMNSIALARTQALEAIPKLRQQMEALFVRGFSQKNLAQAKLYVAAYQQLAAEMGRLGKLSNLNKEMLKTLAIPRGFLADLIKKDPRFGPLFKQLEKGTKEAIEKGYSTSLPGVGTHFKKTTQIATDATKKQTKIRFDLMDELNKIEIDLLDGIAKKRQQLAVDHAKAVKRFRELRKKGAIKSAEDLNDILIGLNEVRAKKKKEIDKEEQKIRLKFEKERFNAEIKVIEEVSDIYRLTISKDVKGIVELIGKKTKSAWLGWIGFGIGVIGDFFSLFSSSAEEAVQTFEDRMALIMDALEIKKEVTSLLEDLLGGETSESIANNIGSMEIGLNKILKNFNLAELTRQELIEILKAYPAFIDKFNEIMLGGLAIDEIGSMVKLFTDSFGEDLGKKIARVFLGPDGQQAIKVFTEIGGLVKGIDDATAKAAIIEKKNALEKIRHEIAIGERQEDNLDTIQDQIDLFDDMLLSLENVVGAQELIMQLEEERFSLQQKINAATKEEVGLNRFLGQTKAGQQLQKFLDLQKQIQLLITEGALQAGARPTVQIQQTLLEAIKANLRAQGARPEVIQPFAEQLARVQTGALGQIGFAARAGLGAPVSIPFQGTPGQQVFNQGGNTRIGDVYINGQFAGPGSNILLQLQALLEQTGINVLASGGTG